MTSTFGVYPAIVAEIKVLAVTCLTKKKQSHICERVLRQLKPSDHHFRRPVLVTILFIAIGGIHVEKLTLNWQISWLMFGRFLSIGPPEVL